MVTVDAPPEHEITAGRRVIAQVAALTYDRRLTELQGGNMSMRIGDAIILTPTKASEETGWRLAPEDMLVQALDGSVIEGDPSRISREIRLHTRLYRAYGELGAVFHLHLPEALAAAGAGRWPTGAVRRTRDEFGAAFVVLEAELKAQTEPHDARVTELLGEVERADGAISISPGHGIFCVGRDVPTAIRAADVFRQRFEFERLRGRLRGARERSRR